MAENAMAQNDAEVIARIIDDASKDRRQLVDGLTYIALQDILVVKCGSFWIPVNVSSIEELKGIAREELASIRLSPGGASIILDSHDIYIEAAMLVAETIEQVISRSEGGLVVELLRQLKKI
jgi:hypothetical protein